MKKIGVQPDIDLFASRINAQLKPYVCLRPDLKAIAIHVFHLSWEKCSFHVFPPLSFLAKVRENRVGTSYQPPDHPTLAHSAMVAKVNTDSVTVNVIFFFIIFKSKKQKQKRLKTLRLNIAKFYFSDTTHFWLVIFLFIF